MTNEFYAEMAETVAELIAEFGTEFTLKQSGKSTKLKGLLTSPKSVYEKGSLVQANERIAFLETKKNLIPAPGDILQRGTTTDKFRVLEAENLAPVGTNVYYKLTVTK